VRGLSVLLRLSLRNLFRNRRRSLITISAVSGGIALFFATINLGAGSYEEMIEQGVSSLAGHVVVQGEGYQESRDARIFLEDATRIRAELHALFPEATIVSRIFLGGLLDSPTNSVGVALTGIEPAAEATVSDWEDKVVVGTWLDEDPNGILVGQGLAESLEVGLGDKLVLMAQGRTR
jgi:putative ABC transport system permease protein